MQEFDIRETELNFFKLLAENWGALTVKGADGTVNAMTIAWGQYGCIWKKEGVQGFLPVATTYVRQSRFSKPLMDSAEYFSISFVTPENKKALGFLGSKSGRDFDGKKIEASGLTTAYYNDVPYIAESSIVLVCRKVYAAPLPGDNFVDKQIFQTCYADGDLHVEYVGEIVAALKA